MKQLVETSFSQITQKSCLSTSNDLILEIFDEKNKKCRLKRIEDNEAHFTVLNPTKREICFLAIDHCVFTKKDTFKKLRNKINRKRKELTGNEQYISKKKQFSNKTYRI